MTFIEKHWKPNHILAQDSDFFDYEHVSKDKINFFIASSQDTNKILANAGASGNPGGTGNGAGCANGSVASGSSGSVSITLGTQSTTNATNNVVLIRIKLAASDSISAISVT